MTTVNYDDLDTAFMFVSAGGFDNDAYICLETGRIYWVSSEMDPDIQEDDLPDDLQDRERYVPIPSTRD